MIEIKNLNNDYPVFDYDVRMDRQNKILGNQVGKGYSRTKSIQMFNDWIDGMIDKDNGPVMNEIQRLYDTYKKHGKLRLFCWCFPKPCHTNIIVDKIRRLHLYKYL